MVADFHGQLLRVRDYEAIKKDDKLSPLFPQGVGEDLKQETLAFVQDVVFSQGRGLKELLTAPYTFANSRVGRMYGQNTPAPAAGRPDPFVRVELDAAQRAGLLTQMGFLAANGEEADAQHHHPRACTSPTTCCASTCRRRPTRSRRCPPVVPNSTNRQRVAAADRRRALQRPATSATSTRSASPSRTSTAWGASARRTTGSPSTPAPATRWTARRSPSTGRSALIKAIAESKQAHDCYSRRWAEYLYGREIDLTNPADAGLVDQAGLRSKANMSVKDLILNLVATDAFVTRLP